MKCLLCHKHISRIRAWRTGSEFCSDDHAAVYKKQTLERLLTEPDDTDRPPAPKLNLAEGEPEAGILTDEANAVEADVRATLQELGKGDPVKDSPIDESEPSAGSADALKRLMEFDSNDVPAFDDSSDGQGLEALWKLADDPSERVDTVATPRENNEASLPPTWEEDLAGPLEPVLGELLSADGDPAVVTGQSADEALAALRALAHGDSPQTSEQPTPESPPDPTSPPTIDGDLEDWQSDLPTPEGEDPEYALEELGFEATAGSDVTMELPQSPDVLADLPALGDDALSADPAASQFPQDTEQSDSPDAPSADPNLAAVKEGVDEELERLSQTLDSEGAGPAPEDSPLDHSPALNGTSATPASSQPDEPAVVEFPGADGEPLEPDTQEAASSKPVAEPPSELQIQPVLALTPLAPTTLADRPAAPQLRSESSNGSLEPSEPSWMSTLEVWALPTTEANDEPLRIRETGDLSASELVVVEAFAFELQAPRETSREPLEPTSYVILAAADEPEEETIMEALPL